MRNLLTIGTVWMFVATLSPVLFADPGQASHKPTKRELPDWVFGANWYQLDVMRFCNGESSNDPTGTKPWSMSPGDDKNIAHQRGPFGGDMQGLLKKLPYLHELGINTLHLTPIFTADLQHVDDLFGVSIVKQVESDEQQKSKNTRTASDLLFLKFVNAAHAGDFRIVVHAPTIQGKAEFFQAMRFWMDPNGDGMVADGIDGWAVTIDDDTKPQHVQKLIGTTHELNPKAIVIGDVVGNPPAWLGKPDMPTFDVMIDFEFGVAIRQLLRDGNTTYSAEQCFKDVAKLLGQHSEPTRTTWLNAASDRNQIGRASCRERV